jgi:hypothetical protein
MKDNLGLNLVQECFDDTSRHQKLKFLFFFLSGDFVDLRMNFTLPSSVMILCPQIFQCPHSLILNEIMES